MSEQVDIKQVLNGSVSEVPIDALTRKGFRQVKVLNQAVVMRLIAESVDQVLSDRANRISSKEREKVIAESKAQFQDLARQRLQEEKSRYDELARENQELVARLEQQQAQVEAAGGVVSERDQALSKLGEVEQQLNQSRQEVAELQELARRRTEELGRAQEASVDTERMEELQLQAKEDQARVAKLEAELSSRTGELTRVSDQTLGLQRDLIERERRIAELEGTLVVKEREFAEGASQANPQVDELMGLLRERLAEDSTSNPEVKGLASQLEGISQKLTNLKMAGGGGGVEVEAMDDASLVAYLDRASNAEVETNVSTVSVRQQKAGAVKGALDKLKKLQQGGAHGE